MGEADLLLKLWVDMFGFGFVCLEVQWVALNWELIEPLKGSYSGRAEKHLMYVHCFVFNMMIMIMIILMINNTIHLYYSTNLME